MLSSNKFQNSLTIVVLDNDKESLKLAGVVIIDGLKDLDQVCVGESGLQGSHRLHEGVLPRPTSTTRRSGHQERSGGITVSLVEAPLVGILVDATELPQDGQPDLCVQCDLVPDGDSLERWWQLHGSLLPEEARIDLSDAA